VGSKNLLVLAAVLVPPSAVAQTVSPGLTPEAVAEMVLAADSSGDWRTLLALAHPEGVFKFHQAVMRLFEPHLESWSPIDSCMGHVGSAAHREAHLRPVLASVFRVPSVDSLRRLSPDSVFARVGRHRTRASGARTREAHGATRKLLGVLLGPRESAYVVIYERYDSLPSPTWPRERTETMTLRKNQGEWRSMLDAGVSLSSAAVYSDEE
jgi:hypothetical protein